MISIVIPTYNEAKYLPKTLDSILNNRKKPDEIIIVDDNSKDGTQEIALSYGAKVITVNKRNIGYARKTGFEHAKGDIIISASADIVVNEDWIEELVSPLKNYDLVYGSIYLQNPDFIEKHFQVFLNNLAEFLWKRNIIWASADNIAFTKSFYNKIGGMKPLKTGEDIDFIKRAMAHGKVFFNKKAIVYTSRRRIEAWGKWKYFWFHFNNFLKLNFGGKPEEEYEPIR